MRSYKVEKKFKITSTKLWAISFPKLKIISFKYSIGGTLWESEPSVKDILTV